jgi:hypothetical protein
MYFKMICKCLKVIQYITLLSEAQGCGMCVMFVMA